MNFATNCGVLFIIFFQISAFSCQNDEIIQVKESPGLESSDPITQKLKLIESNEDLIEKYEEKLLLIKSENKKIEKEYFDKFKLDELKIQTSEYADANIEPLFDLKVSLLVVIACIVFYVSTIEFIYFMSWDKISKD